MAQDFHAAFGLGTDPTKIAPGDVAGVALAAIQAQQKEIERLNAELAALRSEMRMLSRAHDPSVGLAARNTSPARSPSIH